MINSESSDDDDGEGSSSLQTFNASVGRAQPFPSTASLKMQAKAHALSKPSTTTSAAAAVPLAFSVAQKKAPKLKRKRTPTDEEESDNEESECDSDSACDDDDDEDDTSSSSEDDVSSESDGEEEDVPTKKKKTNHVDVRPFFPSVNTGPLVVSGRLVCPPETTEAIERVRRFTKNTIEKTDDVPDELKHAFEGVKDMLESQNGSVTKIEHGQMIDSNECGQLVAQSMNAVAKLSEAAFAIKKSDIASKELKQTLSDMKAMSHKLVGVWDTLLPELERIKSDASQLVDGASKLSSRLVALHATHKGIIEGVANAFEGYNMSEK